VTSFFWTLYDFCQSDLLPFLFTDAEDERQQYPAVITAVTAQLRRAEAAGEGAARIEGHTLRRFRDLVDLVSDRLDDDLTRPDWAGRAIGQGTAGAFIRRLHAAVPHVEDLIRADIPQPEGHRVELNRQLTVVDLHTLHDRAKRFVVGVVLRKAFRDKERTGQARPLLFVVLDELNKYAPREGSSPIKEILLDVSERGRSLGVILIGAQQTASEVERRVIANCSIRVVGRLDSAESGREEYGWLPTTQRQRATILKPGTMLLSQPELPIPLVLEFPFPAWATRPSEAGANPSARPQPADPFEGLVG
jgi:DNA helicase HerA-like ATPase